MRRRMWFGLAVALQVGILLVMMGMKMYTLNYGTKILLKTRPVDPWDMFRGDYVVLNLEISQLDLGTVPHGNEEFKQNDTVYVVLKKGGRYWTARSVSHKRPADGSLAIKGTVGYYNDYEKTLNVNYGIDSYYVPEGQGKVIENAKVLADAEVSVDRRGNSALSRLFLEGEEVKFK